MAYDAGSVTASLELNSKGFHEGLKASGEKLQKFAVDANTAGSSMGDKFKTAGVALVGGATAAVTALAGMAMKAAEAGDNVDEMSQRIGLSAKGYQEWKYVMDQNGASIETFGAGMKTLTSKMTDAAAGGKESSAAFAALGISVTDSSGKIKSQEQIFNESVIALQGMEDGTQKAALASELFGKQGQALMPILNGTAADTAALKQQANDLGMVMSDAAVSAGGEFSDGLATAKGALGAVAIAVGSEVLPIFNSMLSWVLANLPSIRATFETVFNAIGTVAKVVIDAVGFIIEKVIAWVEQNQPLLDEIRTGFEELFTAVSEAVSAFVEFFMKLWTQYGDEILAVIKVAWDLISGVFKTAIDVITNIFKIFSAAFQGDWKGMWEGVKNLFSTVWEGIKSFMKTSLDALVSLVNGIVGAMLAAGKAIITSLWDGIKAIWASIASWAATNIAAFVNKFKDINLLQIGKDIINGLIKGFNSMIGSVGSKIGEVATTVKNKFKSMLGISSPSTVFAEYGENIMDGLQNGINNKTNAPLNSMQAVAAALTKIMAALNSDINDLIGNIDDAADAMDDFETTYEGFDEFAASPLPSKPIKNTGGGNSGGGGNSSSGGGSPTVVSNVTDSSGKQTITYSDGSKLTNDYSQIGGFALGTSFASSGWHWVGEKGPELLNFRGGEAVIPNDRLTGQVNVTNNFTLSGVTIRSDNDIKSIARELKRLQDSTLRGKGVVI